jgi:hypothetical protein
MDALDMIMHRACFICWHAERTLITADFILVVTVIHFAAFVSAGAKLQFFSGWVQT